ncbi:alpha/beta-Hydrolases superfamily protein [Raphanus sativus]|nr:alpha/beta-Hydrolases superfamily protein [Raphanus sativus]
MANIRALPLTSLETSLLFGKRRVLVKNTSTISFTETHFLRQSIPTGIVPSRTPKGTGSVSCSSATEKASSTFEDVSPEVRTLTWNWKGYSIRYQCAGTSGPALVLVHGFGANSDHWRKNTPILGKSYRVYSIDLIGYGYSDKPNPREFGGKPFYTFETWGDQLNDFCLDVVKDEAFFICNSIGGLVGLQAAVSKPEICRGLMLINISLRMLHIKKQPFIARPFIRSFQNLLRYYLFPPFHFSCRFRFIHTYLVCNGVVLQLNILFMSPLRNTPVGKLFFKSIAKPETVRSILSQCYHDSSQVTDELVEAILKPGLEPGAVDVFLEFICYSGGPLPEDLLPLVKCPVLIAWGEKDPWEPIELGRAYGDFDAVEEFVVLPEAGHCPQDEKPEMVNPLIESFVARHSKSSTALARDI